MHPPKCVVCGEPASSVKSSYCSRSCINRGRRRRGPHESFWRKVQVRSPGCWPWLGATDSQGRGHMKWTDGKQWTAPRIMWSLVFGTQPKNLVCHSCDNPNCVNPGHLWDGTHADNVADRDAKNRQCQGSRHHASKLTEDQVRRIYSSSLGLSALGRIYGVAPSSIQQIKLGLRWKSVTDKLGGPSRA